MKFVVQSSADRLAGSDNKVARLQVATDDTTLLIRIHRTTGADRCPDTPISAKGEGVKGER